mmetsp:Transcript_14222/g.33048  ORF Transcript_14222/g.33048 Transcript_14222/m.33048 type:complete len:227 (+) Transcript_14222:105-785(+)
MRLEFIVSNIHICGELVIDILLLAHALKAFSATSNILAHLFTFLREGDIATPKELEVATEFNRLGALIAGKDSINIVQGDEFHHCVIAWQEAFVIGQHARVHVFYFDCNVLCNFLSTDTDAHGLLDTSLAFLAITLLFWIEYFLASKTFFQGRLYLLRGVSAIDTLVGYQLVWGIISCRILNTKSGGNPNLCSLSSAEEGQNRCNGDPDRQKRVIHATILCCVSTK